MSNIQLKIDEEFKSLIPPLSQEEYQQLEQNILNDGCMHELIVWDGTIVDGHNRYEICQKHKIPFKVKNWHFDSRDDVKEWIIRNQFGRRNISDYQRSVLALQLKEIIAARAKENQGKRTDIMPKLAECFKPITTREELAKTAGVSHGTLDKVEKIEKQAPETIKELAKNNVISINKAYEATKAINKMPEQKQQEIIKQIASQTRPVKEVIDDCIKKEIDDIDRQDKLQKLVMGALGKIIQLTPDEECCEAWLSDMDRETIEDQLETVELALSILNKFRDYAKRKLANPLKGVK